MALIELRNCTFTVSDGGGHSQVIKIGNGTCNYSEKVNYEYEFDRGNLDEVREGDEVPLEVSFDFIYEFVTGTGTDNLTPVDVIKGSANAIAAGWVSSTTSDPCQPYSVNITIVDAPPCPGVPIETTVFPDFRRDELSYDLKSASISLKGRCNATEPIVTRG